MSTWLPGRVETRRRKYGNSTASGFDSNKEARRFRELELLVKAGIVRNLQLQVRFEVVPKQQGENGVYYVADFVYEELVSGRWEKVVEDVKSEPTRKSREYVIKRKLMLYRHGIRIKQT